MSVTEFLLARIAEDEAIARSSERRLSERLPPDRLLAECEAKRRIVQRCAEMVTIAEVDTLYDLAAIYADHPNYDEAWRAAQPVRRGKVEQ